MSTFDTDIQRDRDKEYQNSKSDYAAYGAESDAFTNGLANLFGSALGGLEPLIRDILLAVQAVSGVENRGVTMATSIQANLQRAGAPGLGDGMIGGRDAVNMQAAQVMHRNITKEFFNPKTGLPTHAAHGLNQGQIGQITGNVIAEGGMYGAGGAFTQETMTKESLAKLETEGKRRFALYGDRGMMDESRSLKEGDTRQTMNPQLLEKLKGQISERAEMLSSINGIFKSGQFKNFEDAAQAMFGGSMSDFSIRAGRMRLAHIKSMAQSHFGGDTEQAAIFSVGSANSVAQAIGGPGMSPEEAKIRFGLLGARLAEGVDRTAIEVGTTQTAQRGLGIEGRVRTTTEIQQQTAAEKGAMINEEQEALALSHLGQQRAGSLPEGSQDLIDASLKEIQNAGSDEDKLYVARQKASELYERLAGQSVGSAFAKMSPAEMQQALTGKALDRFSSVIDGAWEARNQDNMRFGLEDDVVGQKTSKLSSEEYADMGMGLVNLSKDDKFDLKGILEEPDSALRATKLEAFGLRDTVRDATKAGGVDPERFMGLIKSKGNAGLMKDIINNADEYKGTENFRGAGDRQVMDEAKYKSFMTDYAKGLSTRSDDGMTEFLKGVWGEEEISADLVLAAADEGDITRFDMKDGGIEASLTNAKKFGKALGNSAYDQMGVERGNDQELAAALGSADKRGALNAMLEGMSRDGTMTWDKDSASYLNQKNSEAARAELMGKNRNKALSAVFGKDTKFEALEGESPEDTQKRFGKRMAAGASAAMKDPSHIDGKWNAMDDLIKNYGLKGKENSSLDEIAASDNLTDAQKDQMGDQIEEQIQTAKRKILESWRAGQDDPKLKKTKEWQANHDKLWNTGKRLDELKETLTGQTAKAQAANVNMEVSGNVTITNKGKK